MILTAEQVAEVMELAVSIGRVERRFGNVGTYADVPLAYLALELRLCSLTAPAPVRPAAKEALVTPAPAAPTPWLPAAPVHPEPMMAWSNLERQRIEEYGRECFASGVASVNVPAIPEGAPNGRAVELAIEGLCDWAVSCWHAEVANRPIVNVHRRSLDDTWRQVIRQLGGDPVALLGPAHDDLRATMTTNEYLAAAEPFDPEALIRAVLPGGHSCDPQAVADDIREWARSHATPTRVPLAEEQIEKDLAQVREYPAQRHFFISGVRYAERAHGIGVTAMAESATTGKEPGNGIR